MVRKAVDGKKTREVDGVGKRFFRYDMAYNITHVDEKGYRVINCDII